MSDGDNGPPIDGQDVTGELEPVPFELDATPPDEEVIAPMMPRTERHVGAMTWVLIQGVLGALIVVLVLTEPFEFTTLEEIVGFGLVVFGVFELVDVFRNRAGRRGTSWQRQAIPYGQPLAAIAAGVFLIAWPSETLTVAGYVLAGVFILRGVLDVWAGVRRWHDEGANSWVFVRGLIALALGTLMALFPAQTVATIVFGGAILATARAVIAVWFSVTNSEATASVSPTDTYGIITFWLARHEMDAAEADEVEERVFLYRGDRRGRLWRFATLMFLATTIATFGIASDSTAVVIGAMLVAPLMTPILGTAAGLINGRSRSTGFSAAVTALGAAGAIALAFGLAALIPDLEAVIQNGQVTSRTSPSLLDLGIAIAAGAAGAYGVSRAESSDALPGVAVAIALVPPLAVVGLTLHAGDLVQAWGALLLFLTNLFSILLMAGLVFVIVGYGSWGRLYHRRNRIRVSFAAVAFAVVVISIPLALTARNIIQRSNDLRTATSVVVDWLGEDTRLRIQSLDLSGDEVVVEVIGPDTPPAVEPLGAELSLQIGRPIVATSRWIEEAEETTAP